MYALRPGFSFCFIDRVALFLDARGDRYFAFSPSVSQQFLSLVDAISSGSTVDPDLADSFVARGVLMEGQRDRWWMTPTPRRPTTEWCMPDDPLPPRWSTVCLALLCIIVTLIRLRVRPFYSIVRDHAKTPRRSEQTRALSDRAISAFLLSLRIWPWSLQCMPTSVSLRTFLACYGVRSDLVVAVKLNPFAAHCWVQVGDRVIGDTLEQVCVFTPIRSVR